MKGAGETGDPRENPPTNGSVQHDTHMRKSGNEFGHSLSWRAKRFGEISSLASHVEVGHFAHDGERRRARNMRIPCPNRLSIPRLRYVDERRKLLSQDQSPSVQYPRAHFLIDCEALAYEDFRLVGCCVLRQFAILTRQVSLDPRYTRQPIIKQLEYQHQPIALPGEGDVLIGAIFRPCTALTKTSLIIQRGVTLGGRPNRNLTWDVERQRLAGRALVRVVSGEELVVEGGRPAVAELELAVRRGEVREAWRRLVQPAGAQVHGEAAHLAGAAEERAAPHRCELFQAALFAALVLEPHLQPQAGAGHHVLQLADTSRRLTCIHQPVERQTPALVKAVHDKPLVHVVFDTLRTLAQSSPPTMTSDNQCAVYVGSNVDTFSKRCHWPTTWRNYVRQSAADNTLAQPIGNISHHAVANQTQGHFWSIAPSVSECTVNKYVAASHKGEPGSIPSWVTPRFSQVVAGLRVFSGISRFPRPCFPALLHSDLVSHLTGSQDLALNSRSNLSTPTPISYGFTAIFSQRAPYEGSGKMGYHGESSPTSGIVRHDSRLRISGVTRLGIEPGSSWWEARSPTTQLVWLHLHYRSCQAVSILCRVDVEGGNTEVNNGYVMLPVSAAWTDRHDGNTARLARRSDETLGVRVSAAHIAPSLLDLGRAERCDTSRRASANQSLDASVGRREHCTNDEYWVWRSSPASGDKKNYISDNRWQHGLRRQRLASAHRSIVKRQINTSHWRPASEATRHIATSYGTGRNGGPSLASVVTEFRGQFQRPAPNKTILSLVEMLR
ncbi:hypothetical protein PR048_012102 [Dryococelus australis]|uniref:Uncharacterized protein n=1 Tax=Dryococelus australis TaxID=614101 RepID=A0ABQ9HNH4_9NEOP|nr:hypothetical protein PR048_012102 [Dryococelus australis]